MPTDGQEGLAYGNRLGAIAQSSGPGSLTAESIKGHRSLGGRVPSSRALFVVRAPCVSSSSADCARLDAYKRRFAGHASPREARRKSEGDASKIGSGELERRTEVGNGGAIPSAEKEGLRFLSDARLDNVTR